MAILFNGNPQGPLGSYNGLTSWWDPPYDYAATEPQLQGGLAIVRNAQVQILQDAGARFSGQKYWRFETAPGDAVPLQSGERVELIRPQYWNNAVIRKPEELPGLGLGVPGSSAPAGSSGSPPWGGIRYWGMSFKLHSTFTVPKSFFILWQQKMSQQNWSPWAQVGIRTDEFRDGGLTAGAAGPLRLFLAMNVAKTTTSTPFIDRRAAAPNVELVADTWYDIIWGIKYAFDNTGWTRLWWKLSSASSWNFVSYVENAPLGQWDIDAGNTTIHWTTNSQGIYRGSYSTTHIVYETGLVIAETFDDIALGIYGVSTPVPTATPIKSEKRTRTRRKQGRTTLFDGVDDQVTCALGSTAQGYGTAVGIVQVSEGASSLQHIFGWYDAAAAGHAAPLQYDFTTAQLRYFNGTDAARTLVGSIPAQDAPIVLVARKSTGTVLPRFSWMSFFNRVWAHEDATVTLADHSLTSSGSGIGLTLALGPFVFASAATSHTTASINLVAGRLYLVTVVGVRDPLAATPTLVGAGQTWTMIRSDLHDTNRRNITTFRALPSADNSGALTIQWGANAHIASWAVTEVTGMDTSGTNGSGAIGDTDASSGSGTSGSVTALTLAGATSVNYAAFFHKANELTTPEATWTELYDDQASTNYDFQIGYKLNDSTATASWASSVPWGGQAIELIAGAGGEAPTSVVFGEHISGTTTARLFGNLYACAWFGNKVLSDAEVEGLADPAAWPRFAPTGMWIFDRTKLYDLTGHGANETVRTGTQIVGNASGIYLPETHRGRAREFKKMIETSTVPPPAPQMIDDFLLLLQTG